MSFAQGRCIPFRTLKVRHMSKTALTMSQSQEYKPTFHQTDAPYVLPNDDFEQRRLNAQHLALRDVMGGRMVHAPLKDPKVVVDVGCGSGIVSRELAARFPAARVIGIDLSPPEALRQQPSNLQFVQGDVQKMLAAGRDAGGMPEASLLGPGTVDYIFHRAMALGITGWPDHVSALAGALAPGGWLELQDMDMAPLLEDGTEVTHEWPWKRECIRCAQEKGLNIRGGRYLEEWVRGAGLVDVKAVKYRWNLGHWGDGGRPHMRPSSEYLEKWWPGIMHIMIEKLMEGLVDGDTIKKHQEQMVRLLKQAEQERKAYELTVCYGRKPRSDGA